MLRADDLRFRAIANWRTFVFADLVRRYLEFKGFAVLRVMNITDVEDKIIQRVRETKTSLREFTGKYEAAFLDGLKTLACLLPHHLPRATAHIPDGEGRPGWHVECSAMSMKLLGASFDIHLGGEDLIFPHHEDEIAQSEGAGVPSSGKPFVKYWLHGAHLLVEGKKMSKSLGNFFTLCDLAKGFTGREIRYLLLKSHYRESLNFAMEGLPGARTTLARLQWKKEKDLRRLQGKQIQLCFTVRNARLYSFRVADEKTMKLPTPRATTQ